MEKQVVIYVSKVQTRLTQELHQEEQEEIQQIAEDEQQAENTAAVDEIKTKNTKYVIGGAIIVGIIIFILVKEYKNKKK